MCFILFYFTFTSFKDIFEELSPHPLSLHGDHHYGACKRDDHTILSMGTQATTPTLHPSLAPTPAATIAPFTGMQVMFFSFLFFSIPFLTNVTETLYPTRWVLKPPPLHHASPLKPCKSCCHCCLIHRHVSKDMFFFFSFLF